MAISTPLQFSGGAARREALRPAATTRWSRRTPGRGRAYAPTYWVASAGTAARRRRPGHARHRCRRGRHRLGLDRPVDRAVPGAGARHPRRRARGEPARGAAPAAAAARARTPAAGSKRSQWIERWGLDVAKQLDAEIRTGFENFRPDRRDRLRRPSTAATSTSRTGREAGAAAGRSRGDARDVRLRHAHARARRDPARLLRRARDRRRLFEAEGVGIHPLKFTFGLIRRARALGAQDPPGSPVQGWQTKGGVHHLRTPGGTVRAKRVAVCTGGYTGQALNPLLKNKIMPILSNSVVTRVLTDAELKACNFALADLPDRHAHLALLLSAAEGQPAAARQPQRGDRRRCRRPVPPEAADRCDRAQVPAAGRHRDRLLVVGLGRRQPRHDAAHRRGPTRRRPSGTRSATAATACRSRPGPASGWPSASPARTPGRTSSSCRSTPRRCRTTAC